jgi:hypothetical protein
MTFFRCQRFEGKSKFAGKYKDKTGIAEMASASLIEIKGKKDATRKVQLRPVTCLWWPRNTSQLALASTDAKTAFTRRSNVDIISQYWSMWISLSIVLCP